MSNVPLGEDEQLTMFTEHPLAVSESPRRLLISVWVTMAFLSLYGAPDLHSYVSYDERLAKIWEPPTRALTAIAEVSGVAYLRIPLAAFAQLVDTPHVVLEKDTAPPPPPPPPLPLSGDASDGGTRADEPNGTLDLTEPVSTQLRPTRVLMVGASSIQYYLGAELERRMELYRDVTIYRVGRISTGLARPDMFDWMSEVPKLQRDFRPDLVIGMFGGNDTQGLLMPDGHIAPFGSQEWKDEYLRRVRTMVERCAADGAKMVMLGMPSMRQKKYSQSIAKVNAVTQAATEAAGGTYIETWDISSNPAREYQEGVTYGGETGLMRLPDGQHLSRLGAKFVAEKLMHRFEREFQFTAKDLTKASMSRFVVTSKLLAREVPYFAFVPQGLAADEKRPVVFLLHGRGGSAADWSENAHDLLQRAASEHRLILVAPDLGKDSWLLDGTREKLASFVSRELIADVSRRLPVLAVRGALGISTSGNGALAIALRTPGLFSSVSAVSGTVDLMQATTDAALLEQLGPFDHKNKAAWSASSALQLVSAHPKTARSLAVRLSVSKADSWAPANRELGAALTTAGADPILDDQADGASDWPYWLSVVPAHLAWHASKLNP